jgi:signal transduction histidine kinase
MKEMKKALIYSVSALLFITVNLQLGFYLVNRFKEFETKIAPISLEAIKDLPPFLTGTIDADNDGEDEVFYSSIWHAPNEQQIAVFEPFEITYTPDHYGEILAPINYAFFDIYYNNSLKTYVFRFLELKDGTFFIHDVDNRQNPLHPLKPLQMQNINPQPTGIEGFKGPFLIDLEQDGKKELVVILKSAGYSLPRGVVCFDPSTGKILWRYYSGTAIENAEFVDINNDGKKEIILSTYACNQNISINETGDSHSYAIVLDCKGNPLMKQVMGGVYTYAYSIAADIDNDGKCEIVSSIGCNSSIEQRGGKIAVFDVTEDVIKKQLSPQPVSFSKPLAFKYDKNTTYIYIADSTGEVQIFNKNLELLNHRKVGAGTRILNPSSSIDNWNYIYVSYQDKLVAFDKGLKGEAFGVEFKGPVADKTNPEESIFIPLHTKRGNYALVKYDKLYILSESKELSAGEILGYLYSTGLLLTLVVLVLFNGFWIYIIYKVRVFHGADGKEKNGAEISRILEIVSGIAHQVKNPLSTILWTAEKLKRSLGKYKQTDENTGDYALLPGFLMEDVNALKLHTNNILKLIQIYKPNFKDANIKILLQHIVDHYQPLIREKIGIRLEMEEDIVLSIDEELLKEAFVNVIDNAVDAMLEGGHIVISVVPVISPVKGCADYVLIEVEDTGMGMDDPELSKMFTPFYTKKEKGTGIGLTICKRIIEAHGGTVKIHSRKDFGTKIAFSIPVTR